MITRKNNIVVVDMDGCLCTLNSFRYWLLFSFLFSLVTLKPSVFFKILSAVSLRLLGRTDRVQMKQHVLAATEVLPEYFIGWFSRFLFRFTESEVLAEIRKYEKMSVQVVLNTAAPSLYVAKYSKFYGFSEFFATPSVSESDWKENIGSEKLEVLKLHYGESLHLLCVITDHHDDLPLLLESDKRILVKPTRATLDIVGDRFQFDVIL